jgi:hypothetical protein
LPERGDCPRELVRSVKNETCGGAAQPIQWLDHGLHLRGVVLRSPTRTRVLSLLQRVQAGPGDYFSLLVCAKGLVYL